MKKDTPENDIIKTLALFWEFQSETGGNFLDWCKNRGVKKVVDVAGDENGGLKPININVR